MTHAQRFRDVYEECYPRVLAYATSLVGRQVGEDITSETFTVAWRRVRDIPQPALPWLLGVARNLVRELRRRDSHQYALAAEEAQRISSGARSGVGDVAADVTDRDAALQALASLSDADQERRCSRAPGPTNSTRPGWRAPRGSARTWRASWPGRRTVTWHAARRPGRRVSGDRGTSRRPGAGARHRSPGA